MEVNKKDEQAPGNSKNFNGIIIGETGRHESEKTRSKRITTATKEKMYTHTKKKKNTENSEMLR